MDVKKVVRGWMAAVCALIIASSLMPRTMALADIGWPPIYPSGSSVGLTPGEENKVRMVSEVVTMTIEEHEGAPPFDLGESPAAWMRGFVEAEFIMSNLGQEAQTFDVWFPLAASARYPGMLPWWPENTLQDFKLWIDGEPAIFEQVKAPDLGDPKAESTWARFPITFPPGVDVAVRVNYTIYPTGRRPFGGFEYILQTGAGWYGTIAKAVITVTLPDPVTAKNVSLSGKSIEGLPIAPQPAGYEINRNTLSWELTDFEPTEKDNIYVDVLEPGRYHDLQRAMAGAQGSPSSADAQLRLAAAVENAVILVKTVGQHGGGAALAVTANQAYRRALELAPNRADIYVLYANWLMRSGGAWQLFRGGPCPQEMCDLVSRGLEKFPSNPQLLEINESIQSMLAENAVYATEGAQHKTQTAEAYPREATFQALQTAHALASQTPTPAPATATSTLSPTAPSANTPEPAEDAQNGGGFWDITAPLIGLAVLAGLVAWGLRATYRK